MKKILAILMVAVLSMSLLAACSNKSPSTSAQSKAVSSTDTTTPTTIKFWHGWQGLEAKKFATIIEKFSEVRPDIKVEVLDSATEEKQLVAMTGGDSFDVGLTMDVIANKWANTGALADMQPLMKANGTDMSNCVQSLLDVARIDDKQYGVPFTMDTFMLFYNKDILAEAGYTEPPKTFDEFLKMCEDVTKTDANGDYTCTGYVPNYPGITVAANFSVFTTNLQRRAKKLF